MQMDIVHYGVQINKSIVQRFGSDLINRLTAARVGHFRKKEDDEMNTDIFINSLKQ